MVSAFYPKGVFHVIVDPQFEHGRKSRAEGIVKCFLDSKVKIFGKDRITTKR
jgi:hypothetical protein